MIEHEQLKGTEAIKQLKGTVGHQHICMLVTDPSSYPSSARPMAVGEVDGTGALWFFFMQNSEKFSDLENDPRVTLYIANPAAQEFLSIHGRCEVLNDMARKKELWGLSAKVWVPDGVENPDLRMLKVSPTEGYYWGVRNGKAAAGLKMEFALLRSGAGDDASVEGPLTA